MTDAPQEHRRVRFVTNFTLSQDVAKHGIDGFYRDGRYWSIDGADHWSRNEVTFWTYHVATRDPCECARLREAMRRILAFSDSEMGDGDGARDVAAKALGFADYSDWWDKEGVPE